ncbi:hypothetical protein ACFE04_023094 [Oxalis oulophora]
MAGIAILMDLMRKHPSYQSTQTFSATAAASAAAASIAAGTPFASRFLFGAPRTNVAYCDAGAAAISDDYLASLRRASGSIFENDAIKYSTKEYIIQPKPWLSAFEPRTFALTSVRSLLMFYLPLLEPATNSEEDDDDFLQDTQELRRVDLVLPLKKSVKQIARETTVVTTRRTLERLALHYVSQRMAWKLLKDVPKSATRKALRGYPAYVYFYRVSKSTFRGHFLGVAASWVVQIGIELYRCVSRTINSEEEDKTAVKAEQAKLLGKKITGVTIRCGASLIFASIGAGIGACLVRPSAGQWIGCALGDLAGPIVVTLVLGKVLHSDL